MLNQNTTHYLGIDTETTGLEDDCLLIQVGMMPVNQAGGYDRKMSREWLIECPSFEALEPKLSYWVINHNRALIERAHREGQPAAEVLEQVIEYVESFPDGFWADEKPVFFGKSLSALDIPVLIRTFGPTWTRNFSHLTFDVTSVAFDLVNRGKLPPGCVSINALSKYFGLGEVEHSAVADVVRTADIYQRLFKL